MVNILLRYFFLYYRASFLTDSRRLGTRDSISEKSMAIKERYIAANSFRHLRLNSDTRSLCHC